MVSVSNRLESSNVKTKGPIFLLSVPLQNALRLTLSDRPHYDQFLAKSHATLHLSRVKLLRFSS